MSEAEGHLGFMSFIAMEAPTEVCEVGEKEMLGPKFESILVSL